MLAHKRRNREKRVVYTVDSEQPEAVAWIQNYPGCPAWILQAFAMRAYHSHKFSCLVSRSTLKSGNCIASEEPSLENDPAQNLGG